jgi:outer membrane biosynthesis protein TonB
MLTAIGRASLRRLVARSLIARPTPLLVRKTASTPSVTTVADTVAATLQTRSLSTSRCLAFPVTQKKTTASGRAKKKAAPKKKKPAAKKKAAPKKKKPAAKKKVTTRKKKAPSPEQKALVEKRELKQQALLTGGPATLPDSVWVLFLQQRLKGGKGLEQTAQKMKDAAVEYKTISDALRQVSSLSRLRLCEEFPD